MEDKLRRAFQLAYFILREQQAALRATREAVSALDVTLVRQDKRIHYQPEHRTKVSLGEWQMLQRLVYFAAETEERRQEEHEATEAALVLHYLKHLVYITVYRSSFFVALGLSRILHNYSTAETMQIHELVLQDPERGRDDSYYRRRKAQLMREMLARFGELLTVQRGARGEERFLALPDAQSYLALIREGLNKFTPWDTHCHLPAAFDPHTDELPYLRFRGGDPDGEHEVEIRRMHTLLHPDCFERLLAALRLDTSSERLEVPQLQLRDSQNSTPPNGGQPPTAQLSEEDMQNLKESVIQERERRRRFSPTLLRIVIDGVERTRWLLAQSHHSQIEITSSDKCIEIYGRTDGEDLRLAMHLLSYDVDDHLRPVAAALTLESGQQLRLAIEPQSATDEEDAGATLIVSYRETTLLRALRWWWHRLLNNPKIQFWKPALALLLLALFFFSLIQYFKGIRNAHNGYIVTNDTPTPTISPQPIPTVTPNPRPSSSPPFPRNDVIAMDIRPPTGAPDEPLTRGELAQAAGLLEAQKVYLVVSGTQRERARQLLLKQLPADNLFSLTDDTAEANIALKVTVDAAQQDRVVLTAHIADANGNVIWPLTTGTIGRQYKGPFKKAVVKFSRELAGDLQRLKRQK